MNFDAALMPFRTRGKSLCEHLQQQQTKIQCKIQYKNVAVDLYK